MKRYCAALALLCAIAACSCPFEPAPKQGELEIELRWQGDSDLDIELWSDHPDSASRMIASVDKFGACDRIGLADGVERLVLNKEDITETALIAVHYWSAGPSADTTTTARISILRNDVPAGEASAELDDDSGDLWIPFRISPGTLSAEPVDRFRQTDI